MATKMAAFSGAERRAHPRFHCQGSAEIRLLDGSVQQWATLTDVSKSGCYLETAAPLPVRQRLVLKLTILGQSLVAESRVMVVHPMFGMGVAFTSLSPEAETTLEEIITRLASADDGSSAPHDPPSQTPALRPRTVRLSGEAAVALLGKISQRLAEHGMLTKDEFLAMTEEPGAGRQEKEQEKGKENKPL